MSIKAFMIYALSLTLGIGAVTHAKTQLIEQERLESNEKRELAYYSSRPQDYDFQRSERRRVRSLLNNNQERWSSVL